MENTAQIKIEIIINSSTKIVTVNGNSFIDGKKIVDYNREINNYENSTTLGEVLAALAIPIESDERFEGTTGLK